MSNTYEKPHINYDELSFIKLKFPRLIPRHLIDAVKGRTFTPEAFYDYQEANINNPNNLLFALVNKEKRIYGYLWCEINTLDHSLFINTFSVGPEFWYKGRIMSKVTEFLRTLKDKHKSSKVFWMTTNDKFFTKHGFKRSKNVLMEYNEDNDQQPTKEDKVEDGTK